MSGCGYIIDLPNYPFQADLLLSAVGTDTPRVGRAMGRVLLCILCVARPSLKLQVPRTNPSIQNTYYTVSLPDHVALALKAWPSVLPTPHTTQQEASSTPQQDLDLQS